jgi:transposase-like protein
VQFAAQWDSRYAPIAALWCRHGSQVIPFFAFPAEIRKVICTTSAVESRNMSVRKALKPRVAFPSEEAAWKVMYLALRNVIGRREQREWKATLNCFTPLWEERIRLATEN